MKVYSYDFWDTLFGRWYYTPESIAYEIYKKYRMTDFVNRRKWAEFHSESSNKTLGSIYRLYQEQFQEDKAKLMMCMDMEYGLESHFLTFPIYDTILELKTPYILVSDFYMNRKFFEDRLRDYNVLEPLDYFINYDGKSSGRVWQEIKDKGYEIIKHTGDNISSDYSIPLAHGISAEHYTRSSFTDVENYLRGAGFNNLACLLRMVRLSNPCGRTYIGNEIWNQEVLNLGVMILFSKYIHESYEGKTLLLTQRDCNLLSRLHELLYPNDKVKDFYVSRDLYLHPTNTFDDYIKHLPLDSVIVDLQGTGESCYSYFGKFGLSPDYFVLIDSDRQGRDFPNKRSVVRWSEGFSDKIEFLNYDVLGRVVDIEGDLKTPVRMNTNDDYNSYIKIQHEAFEKGMSFINQGFDLNLGTDLKSGIIILLREIEKGLKITEVVRHEET